MSRDFSFMRERLHADAVGVFPSPGVYCHRLKEKEMPTACYLHLSVFNLQPPLEIESVVVAGATRRRMKESCSLSCRCLAKERERKCNRQALRMKVLHDDSLSACSLSSSFLECCRRKNHPDICPSCYKMRDKRWNYRCNSLDLFLERLVIGIMMVAWRITVNSLEARPLPSPLHDPTSMDFFSYGGWVIKDKRVNVWHILEKERPCQTHSHLLFLFLTLAQPVGRGRKRKGNTTYTTDFYLRLLPPTTTT